MGKIYHIDLESSQIQGARLALLPGDPFRVNKIAESVQRMLGGEIRELAWKREYRSFLCDLGKAKVLVVSTGIGGPSTSIAVEELAMLGVDTFLRVGTTGAIQQSIKNGEVICTTGSVRLDGASSHYAPIEYPAVAHPDVVNAIRNSALRLGVTCHSGITASADTFYPGQERYDSFTGYVPLRFQKTMEEWRRLHVLNYEMESSTLLTMTSAFGLRGGCVAGVIVNRMSAEDIKTEDLIKGETNAVQTAVSAITDLV